jgi:hypothetical protein
MSAPIQIDGPYRCRRAHHRRRIALGVLAGLLLGSPFIAAGIAALLGA